jgi:arylsulfatase A-like enzyme
VDTLRADHTTPYGYSRDTTPELALFAKDAVVFEAAISAAPWTKPSVGSLFTSQMPGQHGAIQLRDPLNPRLLTLAEMLKAKGYVTGAAIANSVIYSPGTNFEKGFDCFAGLHDRDDRVSKTVEAGPVVDAALSWLAQRSGLPAFLYVHTMDPHVPYVPPPPFDRKYEPGPAPGHPGRDPRSDFLEPLDLERMIAQYDGDVAYGDQEFGRFIRELKARGLYDDALIIFLADHGEEFQDHGGWLHGRSVFDELIRIPLIAKFPGNRHAGTRVKQQVRVLDVLPTVLEEMSLPVPPPPAVVGRPLQAVIKGMTQEVQAFSEATHRGYVVFGVRTDKDKYVWRFSPFEDELYFDLHADPREQASRFEDARERAHNLKGQLESVMQPNPYQHHLKLVGAGRYDLVLHSRGFVEGMEAVGLGPGERHFSERVTREVHILAEPRPGQPREFSFRVRPMGAPVWVSGTRDGRPLKTTDVYMAREGIRPRSVPFRLPEVEPVDVAPEREGKRPPATTEEETARMLEPPATSSPGIHVWLTLRAGVTILEMDAETRERLKALGYIQE